MVESAAPRWNIFMCAWDRRNLSWGRADPGWQEATHRGWDHGSQVPSLALLCCEQYC